MNAIPENENPTRLTLRGGGEVLVRPLVMEDLEAILAFFRELPEEDRKYLRFDVTDPEVVKKRIKTIQEWGRLKRLIVMDGERIVGTGVLELHDEEAGEAEVRLIIAHDFQRLGLGVLLARELYFLAIREGVQTLMISYLAPNKGAREICHRLGFRHEEIQEGAGIDRAGNKTDLVVARCPIQEIFDEMEHYLHDFDWQRSR